MKPLGFVLVVALLAGGTACGRAAAQDDVLQVSGSTTVNPVAADAAEFFRRDGLQITVDTQGGSAGGLSQLAAGQIDIAMSSKPVTDQDRASSPEIDFWPTQIGGDAVGLVVRREVAEGGVSDLSRSQARGIFEATITNWAEVGGPDLPIFVYDKEPGRGTREVLDDYLYGDKTPPAAPTGSHYAVVGGNEESRTKLASTPGSVGPLSTGFILDSTELVALSLDGVEPSARNVERGTYPLSRGLFLVTDGPPVGEAKVFVDYVISPHGQEFVREHGYLSLDQLGS